jgi:predicted O-methyltransferase YrrM
MRLAQTLRDGASVVPLLAHLGRLGADPSSDELVDFALGYKAIRPLQNRSELLELTRLVADLRPKTVVEIGTFRGGTLFIFARLAAPDATIISLDLPASVMGRLYRAAQVPLFHRFTHGRQQLHLLREDSHRLETLVHVTAALGGKPLDFLFIDGDHTYESVRTDFERFSPLVRPGGLIAFHDIAMPAPSGVARLWGELAGLYPRTAIVHDTQVRPMGIGVLWKTPVVSDGAEPVIRPATSAARPADHLGWRDSSRH